MEVAPVNHFPPAPDWNQLVLTQGEINVQAVINSDQARNFGVFSALNGMELPVSNPRDEAKRLRVFSAANGMERPPPPPVLDPRVELNKCVTPQLTDGEKRKQDALERARRLTRQRKLNLKILP